jgi:hypothetical protein
MTRFIKTELPRIEPHRLKQDTMKRIAWVLSAVAMVAGVVDGRAQATRTEVKRTLPPGKTVRGVMHEGGSMQPQTSNLFLLGDLGNDTRTKALAKSDLNALNAVADWINSLVARPHRDLGRSGAVCPFVPGALERRTLWLAPERIGNRSAQDVVQLMDGYKRLLLDTQPIDGDDASYKVIVVVFTDLPADRAKDLFGNVLQHLAVPSYVENGILFGPFYEGNEGTALYNSGFRPFQSPVPFLFVRYGVVSDWKFFLNNDTWLNLWAHRFGESGAKAVAEELRRTSWPPHDREPVSHTSN